MSQTKFNINVLPTPNPSTLKFEVSRPLLKSGVANFTTKASAQKTPLAKFLFELHGVEGVMIGPNFVSVTKAGVIAWDEVHENLDWMSLVEMVKNTLTNQLAAGQEVVVDGGQVSASKEGDNEASAKIKKIIDEEVRPAVAMDGGDVVFDRYENGIVYLHLRGACAGCPGATMTLKMGIETRLKEDVPEIKDVIAI